MTRLYKCGMLINSKQQKLIVNIIKCSKCSKCSKYSKYDDVFNTGVYWDVCAVIDNRFNDSQAHPKTLRGLRGAVVGNTRLTTQRARVRFPGRV